MVTSHQLRETKHNENGVSSKRHIKWTLIKTPQTNLKIRWYGNKHELSWRCHSAKCHTWSRLGHALSFSVEKTSIYWQVYLFSKMELWSDESQAASNLNTDLFSSGWDWTWGDSTFKEMVWGELSPAGGGTRVVRTRPTRKQSNQLSNQWTFYTLAFSDLDTEGETLGHEETNPRSPVGILSNI